MTTPENIQKLLKDYLDDLNDETMREFQWHLSLNEINGVQPIPNSKLRDVTRPETVGMMVQAYGETKAAEVMMDILFRMNQNDLGSRLFRGNA